MPPFLNDAVNWGWTTIGSCKDQDLYTTSANTLTISDGSKIYCDNKIHPIAGDSGRD